jgi:hypothetical protein|tara:strand:- start:1597 stop:2475 length:879 start_codon:yes stop_codon:yes gene_type:complete
MGLFQGTQQNYYTTASSFGNYQTISLKDIINNFEIAYVGEGKIIPKQKRSNIVFFAKRALQELSYDTLKSEKSQEIEISPNLVMALPHDYVNYVKITWKDTSGVERIIYQADKTSNPLSILQDGSYNYLFDSNNNLSTSTDSDTWSDFKASSNATSDTSVDDSGFDTSTSNGGRFGLEPSKAQSNGVFYIDPLKSRIHFSADINGKTVTLKYISDSLATDDEMKVHKFVEEAIYKFIAHSILASSSGVQEYIVARFKKEKFAAVRNAKLRLSNLKIEDLTQVMRGKSKQIKH